jgi:hypothetical protein
MMNITVFIQTLLVLLVHPNLGSESLADILHHPWQEKKNLYWQYFQDNQVLIKQTSLNMKYLC